MVGRNFSFITDLRASYSSSVTSFDVPRFLRPRYSSVYDWFHSVLTVSGKESCFRRDGALRMVRSFVEMCLQWKFERPLIRHAVDARHRLRHPLKSFLFSRRE